MVSEHSAIKKKKKKIKVSMKSNSEISEEIFKDKSDQFLMDFEDKLIWILGLIRIEINRRKSKNITERINQQNETC